MTSEIHDEWWWKDEVESWDRDLRPDLGEGLLYYRIRHGGDWSEIGAMSARAAMENCMRQYPDEDDFEIENMTIECTRPVDKEYYNVNEPPEGFSWTYEKRIPQPGEYYLSKNGNAILCEKIRKNNQTRHILRKHWGYYKTPGYIKIDLPM